MNIKRRTMRRVSLGLTIGLLGSLTLLATTSFAITLTGPVELTVQSKFGPTQPLNIDLNASGSIFFDSQVFQKNGVGIFFPSSIRIETQSLELNRLNIITNPVPDPLSPSVVSPGGYISMRATPIFDPVGSIELTARKGSQPFLELAGGTISIGGPPSVTPTLPPDGDKGGGTIVIPSFFSMTAGGTTYLNGPTFPTLPWPHTDFAVSILTDADPIEVQGDVLLHLTAPFVDSPQVSGRIEALEDIHLGDYPQTASVPEPLSVLLLGSGLIGLMAWRYSSYSRRR